MTRATFQAVGAYLWGSRWRAEMARTLKVDRRTVTRWDTGESPVPDYAADRLGEILTERKQVLDRLLAKVTI